jgi:Raf kinase inhibitor-like YbhB/YbcL family protein
MKLRSDSWTNGDRIPEQYAAGRPLPDGGVAFSDNLNPHLAWSELPRAARSLVLICHDFDVPSHAEDVNQPGREVSAELERVDFFHWVLVDLPAQAMEIAPGEFSRGFTPRGKPGPETLHGARHGLNDYTRWFASDPERAGSYFGYDGPFPPFNDSLVHHYVFTLYALRFARLPLEGHFTGHQVRAALAGQVLDEATYSGTYTLNPRLVNAGR